MQTFADLGVSPSLVASLGHRAIINPTPIQAGAIPVAIAGRDVIGIAQTGTGKTLAFSLPILQSMLESSAHALVLVPTRELALQVEENVRAVTRHLPTGVRTISLIGGVPMYRQIRELKSRPRFIVATPGRLNDLLNQNAVSLQQVSFLVLDEADRMFDMGFAPQVNRILEQIPAKRQTMLFSATMSPEVAKLAMHCQHDPARIEVAAPGTSAANITQELCYVGRDQKLDVLKQILADHQGTTLIFTRTKHGATKLKSLLDHNGYSAAEIHSNRSLGQRRAALDGFKSGRYRILVATDIAARGIDVQNIGLVVNYDLPDATEDYVHRIGRTGRAGKDGWAISLAHRDQRRDVQAIERMIKREIPISKYSPITQVQTGGSDRPSSVYSSGRDWRPARPQRGQSQDRRRESSSPEISSSVRPQGFMAPRPNNFRGKRGFQPRRGHGR